MQKLPTMAIRISLVLDQPTDKMLDELAADLGKSRSEVIRILINQEYYFRGLAQKEA